MRDFIDFFLPVILLIVVVIAGALFGENYYEEYTCGKYADVTGRETKWVFMHDCYINTGGDWLTKDEYVVVLVAREGLQSR